MGELLDSASSVFCPHGGLAASMPANHRVVASSVPLAILSDPYVIVGCQNAIPCVTARFITAATRVRGAGVPVLSAAPFGGAPTGSPTSWILESQ
jgi:hypothetical protein